MISLSLIHFVHGENGDGLVPTLYSSGAFIQGARYYYSTCTFPPFFFPSRLHVTDWWVGRAVLEIFLVLY